MAGSAAATEAPTVEAVLREMNSEYITRPEDQILVTGSNGFIGVRVIKTLLDDGFRNLRCFSAFHLAWQDYLTRELMSWPWFPASGFFFQMIPGVSSR